MGLASKLAAIQANSGGYSTPPAQQQTGAGPGTYPGQQSYQTHNIGASHALPGPPAGGPQQTYGSIYGHQQPPTQAYQQQQQQQQQQNQHGAAVQQARSSVNVDIFKRMLQRQIQEKNLQNFYFPNSPAVDQIAHKAVQRLNQFCTQWRLPPEVGFDICKLGLYDIVIFIDNSGSMVFEESGERIKDLQEILTRVSGAATLFDDDGISIRVMNDDRNEYSVDQIKSEAQVTEIMGRIKFNGLTPLGSRIRNKVIDPMVVRQAQNRMLRKPVLLIVITDGQPAGEPPSAIFDTLRYASHELNRLGLGDGALACQFAQVGTDLKAREFLAKLDSDSSIGGFVDCTSNYESEAQEMKEKSQIDLTPELWLVKMLLGAIDPSYDDKDEAMASQSGGRPSQTIYPQGFNPPQGPQQNAYGDQQHNEQYGYMPPIPPNRPGTHGAPVAGVYPPQQQQGGYAVQPIPPPGHHQAPYQQQPNTQQQAQYQQYPQYSQPPPPRRY